MNMLRRLVKFDHVAGDYFLMKYRFAFTQHATLTLRTTLHDWDGYFRGLTEHPEQIGNDNIIPSATQWKSRLQRCYYDSYLMISDIFSIYSNQRYKSSVV